MTRLLDDGLDSSSAILAEGRERFLETYANDPAFGPDVARHIFAQAETNAARAMAAYARFSPTINKGPVPAAVDACPAELKGVPNYETLFGSLDGCACEPCESVYSPAAYLTDLLAFLENEVIAEKTAPVRNGLEGLTVRPFCDRDGKLVSDQPRRPDIVETKLSCRNAETALPYIDLVLEILENAVEPRHAGAPQTSLTEDQLAAQPEHVIPAAYEKLARAVFPFNLPFDLPHEESTVYLERLGTSRVELLETFFPFADGNDPHDLTEIRRWQDKTIAAAQLGLTEVEWDLITARPTNLPRFVSEVWGYPARRGSAWWRPLEVVDTLLQRSGLEYNDLLRLLALKSVNPRGQIRLVFEDPNDCNPKRIHLAGLNTAALSYVHRFLRLQRAMGWSLQTTDRVVRGLALRTADGRPALDEALLVRVAHLVRLQDRFKLPLEEVLAWWTKLDAADYRVPQLPYETVPPSLYDSLFLATGRSGEAQYDAFRLNAARSELEDVTGSLADPVYRSVVAGALRLPLPDVERLVRETLGDQLPTLSNLSTLFRHASLARALRLPVADHLILRQLIGFDPFKTANDIDKTTQTMRYLERVEQVRKSSFSIAEVDYVLRQTVPYESGKTVAPTVDWVDKSLDALRAAVEPLAPFNTPRRTLAQAIALLGAAQPTVAAADEQRALLDLALEQIGAVGEAERGRRPCHGIARSAQRGCCGPSARRRVAASEVEPGQNNPQTTH